jgi:hypothetical protein
MRSGLLAQMGRVGAVAVAKAVKVSRGLQRLELDDNQISEDGVEHLRVRSSSSSSIRLSLSALPCSMMLQLRTTES